MVKSRRHRSRKRRGGNVVAKAALPALLVGLLHKKYGKKKMKRYTGFMYTLMSRYGSA